MISTVFSAGNSRLSRLCLKIQQCTRNKAFLKNQLARAGTSIGANIHESTYAESPEDFIHKLGIALKECNETEYWLNIVAEICPDLKKETLQLKHYAGSIRRMLIASIVTVKQRLGIEK